LCLLHRCLDRQPAIRLEASFRHEDHKYLQLPNPNHDTLTNPGTPRPVGVIARVGEEQREKLIERNSNLKHLRGRKSVIFI
jgi:hypothetical protein